MTNAPIRVLFVVPDLRFGGAERHVATLLPKMNQEKFSTSVVCIGAEGELFTELANSGVEADAFHLGGKANGIRALARLVRHMRRVRPDVVVLRGYNAEILGCLAAVLSGVKHTVVWVHDVGNAEYRSPVRNVAGRLLMSSTSRYFGVANAQMPYITEGLHCPAENVRIIHNGVDPSLFDVETDRSVLAEFGIDFDAPVVGIVAALRPEKDHGTLLHAGRILIDECPDAQILIVGDGPSRLSLERLSNELGIERNVHFAGSRSDIANILRAIDVFVLCSITECFPLSILEAMAAARPVVCSNVGGVGEMVDDGVTGYLVPAGDPQKLTDRLRDVLSDPDLAHRMGRAGRRRVESDFTLDQSVAAAESAIEEIAQSV